jgi:hypothetical protein
MGEDSKHANRIDAREKFDNALESLVTDSCRAWDHWMVLLHLNEARGEYGREMAQSPIFWNTIYALCKTERSSGWPRWLLAAMTL